MGRRKIKLGTRDGKPMEWMVLKKDEYQTLVMSTRFVRTDHFGSRDCHWKDSGSRSWLNRDFFRDAFSEEEKKRIVNSYLVDEKTKDNVFFLSLEEAELYLTSEERRNFGDGWSRSRDGNSIMRLDGNSNYADLYSRSFFPVMYIRTI